MLRPRRSYALLGWFVARIIAPWAISRMRKRTRQAAVNGVKQHPAEAGIAVGALAGAAAWLATRIASRHRNGESWPTTIQGREIPPSGSDSAPHTRN